MTYFDHNASSPLLPAAREAWLEAEDRYPGNPSSPHRIAARAETALDEARQRLASLLGCSPLDIVWTSGSTEACNTVLHHAAHTSPPGASVWIGSTEHPAVIQSAHHYFDGRVNFIPVDTCGVTDIDRLASGLRQERPALVALMAANNETGVLQPWREAGDLCAAAGVDFFCDATQWCGRRAARGLGECAFVAGSAHKFGGPRGVGFLKIPSTGSLRSLLHGGKQQQSRRAGTENVSGIIAMLAALEWCAQQLASGGERAQGRIRAAFEEELVAAVPGVRINGAGAERLWNTVSAVMPAADCRQRWVVKLDKAGFAVSTGSACASGSEEPSHVLSAMGLDAAQAGRALRFSGSWLTQASAWQDLLVAISRIHAGLAGSPAARAGR